MMVENRKLRLIYYVLYLVDKGSVCHNGELFVYVSPFKISKTFYNVILIYDNLFTRDSASCSYDGVYSTHRYRRLDQASYNMYNY